MKKLYNHCYTKTMKPDYPKIILVGIPIGFIIWFVLIFPSFYIARLLDIRDYWFYLSLFFTLIVMSGYFVFCIKNPLKVGAAIVSDSMVLKSNKDDFKCELCGNLFKENHAARIWQESISGKNILCCSDCYSKKVNGSYKLILFLSIIQIFFGIFFINFTPEENIGWLLLNLMLVFISSIIMIIPHELGHVLVAKILGVFVPAVIIGKGKTVFIKPFLSVSWEFKNIPFGGITIALLSDHFNYRKKLFFVTIAGPLVNLFFILLLLLIFPTSKLFTDLFSLRLSFVSALFLANLIDFFYNMLPIRVDTNIGKIPNDGLNLIILSFLTEDAIKQRIKDTNRIIYQIKNLTKFKF